MTFLIKVVAGAFGLYALILLGLYFGQRALMYLPDRQRVDPASVALTGVSERVLNAPDGTRLISWQARARGGAPTILYFHGNAGNLASRAERIKAFQERGWGVLMLSYRGYGGSGGRPSEPANIADGELAFQALLKDGITETDIVIYGESLGTGVAVQIAAKHDVAGLILDAPFTSMVDAAAYHYPWMWVRPFITDRYDSAAHILKVKSPILILHGKQDRVIPVAMGRRLAAIAKDRARLEIFPEGGHVDLYDYGALGKISAFIETLGK